MEDELVEVRIFCKTCAKEATKLVPREIFELAQAGHITLTGDCEECIERGDAGLLKKLMRERGF